MTQPASTKQAFCAESSAYAYKLHGLHKIIKIAQQSKFADFFIFIFNSPAECVWKLIYVCVSVKLYIV